MKHESTLFSSSSSSFSASPILASLRTMVQQNHISGSAAEPCHGSAAWFCSCSSHGSAAVMLQNHGSGSAAKPWFWFAAEPWLLQQNQNHGSATETMTAAEPEMVLLQQPWFCCRTSS
ncbi:uncharacterized protein G2W53_018491 [Senna tora]|uniref:Uncharacterized protein n=1 Tax=Senna tora TaxID=362788 RepID=A0A834TSM6_9FABA|nr:uncharacterized protein G2W53_018491 [Senna tora]